MILYTSVTNKKLYLILTIITFIFAQVYNLFSHDVYSIFMTYAFIIPLVFGFIPNLLKLKTNKFYNASIITFTIYSLLRGFLEIYGTTNSLINIYLYVGVILIIISFIQSLLNQ